MKSGGNDGEGYDSDTTTVNNDTFTPSEIHKKFYVKAYDILTSKDVKHLPDSTKTNENNKNIFEDLNKLYENINGKNKDYKTLVRVLRTQEL